MPVVNVTRKLMLPLLVEGGLGNEVAVNYLICVMDALLQPAIERQENYPPSNAEPGQCYVMKPSTTLMDEWADFEHNSIAFYYNGWHEIKAYEGMMVYNKQTDRFEYFDGSSWNPLIA